MRMRIWLAGLVVLAVVLNAQVASEWSGNIVSLEKEKVVIRTANSEAKEFSIDEKLARQAGLKPQQHVTVFYDSGAKVNAVKIGDQMWHQRECSRDNCRCTKYNCKPSCSCKRKEE